MLVKPPPPNLTFYSLRMLSFVSYMVSRGGVEPEEEGDNNIVLSPFAAESTVEADKALSFAELLRQSEEDFGLTNLFLQDKPKKVEEGGGGDGGEED